MKYRSNRGTLRESLLTAVDLPPTREALARHVGANPDAIQVCLYHAGDARIGWTTYVVKVDGCPCGFTDGPLQS